MERIQGRPAGIDGLPEAAAALGEFHKYLLHGDTCRYNIIVTPAGRVRFIDLENAVPRLGGGKKDNGAEDLEQRTEAETESLRANLAEGGNRLKSEMLQR